MSSFCIAVYNYRFLQGTIPTFDWTEIGNGEMDGEDVGFNLL